MARGRESVAHRCTAPRRVSVYECASPHFPGGVSHPFRGERAPANILARPSVQWGREQVSVGLDARDPLTRTRQSRPRSAETRVYYINVLCTRRVAP